MPNAGQKLERMQYKQDFNQAIEDHICALDTDKSVEYGVIYGGDLNCAHQEIDLARPKGNEKTAGFTPQERSDFTRLLLRGPFKDTYRELYPTTTGYTYYSYRGDCKTKNIGWRLDYFLVSERMFPLVTDVEIRKSIEKSDHVPLVIMLDFKVNNNE